MKFIAGIQGKLSGLSSTLSTIKTILLVVLLVVIVLLFVYVVITMWVKNKMKGVAAAVALLIVAFIGGMYSQYITLPQTTTQISELSVDDIEMKLEGIAELSTYVAEYSLEEVEFDAEKYLNVKNISVKLTTTKATISCTGYYKVGYDFDQIQIEIDNENNQILITLPEVREMSNYIDWKSLEYEDSALFSRSNFSNYSGWIDEILEKGAEKAITEGVYEKAEENMMLLINGFLSEFDYEIIYQ